MTLTYEMCNITPQLIKEAFDLCMQYDMFRAGICCSRVRQLPEISNILGDIEEESPPWYVDQILSYTYGIRVRFSNNSELDIFIGDERSRGKKFHWLRVDEDVDEHLCDYVLRFLVKDYRFADVITEDNKQEDLLTFAEAMLGQPLHHWQRDMLISMLKGSVYTPGRSLGKTVMTNVFKEWKERPQKEYTVIYTYDALMEGTSV